MTIKTLVSNFKTRLAGYSLTREEADELIAAIELRTRQPKPDTQDQCVRWLPDITAKKIVIVASPAPVTTTTVVNTIDSKSLSEVIAQMIRDHQRAGGMQ